MKLLNIGIVGTGDASSMHFEVLKKIPGVSVQAVYGRDAGRLAQQLQPGGGAGSSGCFKEWHRAGSSDSAQGGLISVVTLGVPKEVLIK